MSLSTFKPAYRGLASRDLIDLQQRVGGSIGQLSVGTESLMVLRMRDNLYAATQQPKPALKTVISLEQNDLHVVRTNADIWHLARRFRDQEGYGTKG